MEYLQWLLQENTCKESFLCRVLDFRPATLLRKGSTTSLFQWMSWIFLENPFKRIPDTFAELLLQRQN